MMKLTISWGKKKKTTEVIQFEEQALKIQNFPSTLKDFPQKETTLTIVEK